MTKKFQDVILHLEHDTRKPMKKRLKNKMRMTIQIARWHRQGYRIVGITGDEDDPIFQQLCKLGEDYKERGKIHFNMGDMYQTASKVTGAKVEDIQNKVEKQLNKWKRRFKGVLPT